ncbi:glycoside hydrolase family 65 protein [Rhexocercosporidium sp. MPI-PUGE-AT-0058]|nr:glycoside hydrolase family 65 protein [Rhexocercosporidium sp. MPI-PUGE-AT-0058]
MLNFKKICEAAASLAVILVSGVSAVTDFSPSSGISDWDQSDWSLTANTFIPGQFQSRLSLSNGYTGASLAAAGPFFEVDVNQTDASGTQPSNGWPLYSTRISFATVAGFFDLQDNATGTNYPWLNQYGWESFIAGIPHASAIVYKFGDDFLDANVSNKTISNFSSKLSFKTGVAKWAYTWTPESCGASFNVSYSAIYSRERPNVLAVKATIIPSADISGTVTDLLDGRSAVRSYLNSKGLDDDSQIVYTSVHPNGLSNVTAWIVSGANFSNGYTDLASRAVADGCFVGTNETTMGQTFNISLKAGEPATFYKYVGIASNDKFADAEGTARASQKLAQEDGWDTLVLEHADAWGKIMTEDSIDNFTDPVTGQLPDNPDIKLLQIASVANAYYLLQALQPDGSGLNDESISVGGLVSDSYAGLRFWDADYWMAAGLNIAFPGWSKQISNLRIKQYAQAVANAAFNNFPNGSALYSWTTGRYGNCTGTGPCVDYQYHLNHDIAFNLIQEYNITKNETWFNNGPKQIIESVATSVSELLKLNETTQKFDIYNMTDPDEYANNIDNGAFTLASSSEVLRHANELRFEHGDPINETWKVQADNVAYPVADSMITLEYSTMNNSAAVKQADIVLINYPLVYSRNYTDTQKLLDLDYYANRQSPDGPAMTYSIFAINANELSPSGCSAYTYTQNGFEPYLRAPWYQFSEQVNDDPDTNGNTKPAFPFLTGHGGANQVIPFGYLGIRTTQPQLYIDPSLPPQIPYVKVRTFYYAGATFTATMNSTHTNLTRLATDPSVKVVDISANTTVGVVVAAQDSESPNTNYTLAINQTITVPNRLYWQKVTSGGNINQCLPVTSDTKYAQGQFPFAAIDGATATRWQPINNETASITVNMTSIAPQLISNIHFNWGLRPARSAVVYLGNSTDGIANTANEVEIMINGIEPDKPFDAAAAANSTDEVLPVQGNVTTFSVVGGQWTGNYARLVIEGCWEEDGDGATVGEFELIGSS